MSSSSLLGGLSRCCRPSETLLPDAGVQSRTHSPSHRQLLSDRVNLISSLRHRKNARSENTGQMRKSLSRHDVIHLHIVILALATRCGPIVLRFRSASRTQTFLRTRVTGRRSIGPPPQQLHTRPDDVRPPASTTCLQSCET